MSDGKAPGSKEVENVYPFSVNIGQVYDGPLDLLLDLIRKQDIDIYDIPIAKITAQFLVYVEQLKQTDIDAAGDFIYTASLLIHIKSRMLLPRTPVEADAEIEDPRFKNAAQMLRTKQQIEEATWTNPGLRQFREESGDLESDPAMAQEIAADVPDLVRVFRDILERAKQRPVFDVDQDTVTVGQMIEFVRRRLTMEDRPISLRQLLRNSRTVPAIISMFLALLELVRLQAILLRQDNNFADIYIKKHANFDQVASEALQARDDWR
jgi:segregation and condensation protein A